MTAAARLLALVGLLAVASTALRALPPPEGDAPEPLVAERSIVVGPRSVGRAAEVDAAPAGEPTRSSLRLRSVSTAPVRPRVPWPEGAEPSEEARSGAAVGVLRPVLRIDDADEDALARVLDDPAVAAAVELGLGELDLADGSGLSVAVADPGALRPLTPSLTADAPQVWAALDRGEVVLSPDVAAERRLRAGDELAVRGGRDLAVAGSASNGAPPLVDAIAGPDAPVRTSSRSVLLAVTADADVPALAARLGEATGSPVRALPGRASATARLVGEDQATVEAFEPFTFRPASGGRIDVDPAWESRNIVTAQVPILGEVRCHRLVLPQLRAALQALVDDGLADLLDAGDYGGCYVPRHIDWTPAASLSMHAWGIAIDVNVSSNGLGVTPQLDHRVVEAFTARGFDWGGRWRRPDGMHFELHRLMAPEELAASA